MAFTTVESLDESVRKRLYDEFVVYELYDNDGVQHCRRCNISSTPQWRKGPDGMWDDEEQRNDERVQHTTTPTPGRNTLCNACGVKFANALRKVVGVGAGEYVAGPSEAARIVRKRQSTHSLQDKHKKYKMEDMHHKHHYKSSKPKKRRPLPPREDDGHSGGALTPGQRRSGRPLKPSKVFAEYSVYHDDESVEETSSSEPSSMPSPRIPAHKPSRGESDVADMLLRMRDPGPSAGPGRAPSRGTNPNPRYTSSYGGRHGSSEEEDAYSGGGRGGAAYGRSGGPRRVRSEEYEEDDWGDTTSAMHHQAASAMRSRPPPPLLTTVPPPPMSLEEEEDEDEGDRGRGVVVGGAGAFRAPDLGKQPAAGRGDARSGKTCKECRQVVTTLKGMGMCKPCYSTYWRTRGGRYEGEAAPRTVQAVYHEYDQPLTLADVLPEWQACSTMNQLTAVVIDHLLAVLHNAKEGGSDEQVALQYVDQALSSYRGLALTMHQQRQPPTVASAPTPPSDSRMLKPEDIPPPLDTRRGEGGYHGGQPNEGGLAPPLFGRGGRGAAAPWYPPEPTASTPPPAARKRVTSGVRPIQLLVNSGLLKQGERVCYRTKTGPAKLWGTIRGYDILCDGCGKLNSCLEFERCAGSNNKKPTRHIFTESMRCMQDLIVDAKSMNTTTSNSRGGAAGGEADNRENTPPATAPTPPPQQHDASRQEINGGEQAPGAPTPTNQSPQQQDPQSILHHSPVTAAMAAAVAAHGGVPMQLSDEAQARMKAAVATMIPSEALVALQQQHHQQQHAGHGVPTTSAPLGGPGEGGAMGHTTLVLQPGAAGQHTDAVLVGVPVSETGQMQAPVAMLPVSITATSTEGGVGSGGGSHGV